MTRPRSAHLAIGSILALTLTAYLPARAARQQDLPPDGDAATERLAASPRHGEWVQVDAGEAGPVTAWVVYPERSDAAPVVVVVHEIFGMSDWIRAVADSFAAEGFIAIAPDLLSGKRPDGGGTDTIAEPRRAISALDPGEVKLRIDASAEYALSLPAAGDKYGVVGFCWGGSTTFRYAAEQPGAAAAIVYYGAAPDEEALGRLQVPVLGLYGGDDARVNATIEGARATIDAQGGRYEVEIYEGAGHGFLRAQSHPERGAANLAGAAAAWPRAVAFFRELLGS